MTNAEVLRMAKAMLTPAIEVATNPDAGEDDGDDSTIPDDGGVGSIPDDGVTTLALTPEYVATTPTFDLDDPTVLERLQVLLEVAVRALYPKGLLSGHELPAPIYPLVGEDEFPLPENLAAATACYAAWMLTGESKLKTAYESALDGYLVTLEAKISPIVNRYR
ncbi:MAG: hypothetical protein J6R82_00590 [Clostridia bacterium]|nr:hypothetical protein [Clostridia bacterium]